jgi:hypothetical protein
MSEQFTADDLTPEVIAKMEAIAKAAEIAGNGKRPYVNWKSLDTTVRKYLKLGDDNVLPFLSGVVIANKLKADPVWAFILAPPGGVKTELIRALDEVDNVFALSTLTPQTLVSGYRSKCDPSLLPKLSNHILTLKDFTTVLTMHRDGRQEVLSQLREIYDGSYKKAFGTGKVVSWKGKIGFIAGCTPVLDSHHAVFSVLGERFITLRIQTPDPIDVSEYLINQTGREQEMRSVLSAAFASFIQGIRLPSKPIVVNEAVVKKLSRLAVFVVRARSGVVRDAYSRELEYVPEPEAPTRLTLQLSTFLQAVTLLGCRLYAGTRLRHCLPRGHGLHTADAASRH